MLVKVWVRVGRWAEVDEEEEEEVEGKEDGINRRDTTPRQCPITAGTMGATPHTCRRNAFYRTHILAGEKEWVILPERITYKLTFFPSCQFHTPPRPRLRLRWRLRLRPRPRPRSRPRTIHPHLLHLSPYPLFNLLPYLLPRFRRIHLQDPGTDQGPQQSH